MRAATAVARSQAALQTMMRLATSLEASGALPGATIHIPDAAQFQQIVNNAFASVVGGAAVPPPVAPAADVEPHPEPQAGAQLLQQGEAGGDAAAAPPQPMSGTARRERRRSTRRDPMA